MEKEAVLQQYMLVHTLHSLLTLEHYSPAMVHRQTLGMQKHAVASLTWLQCYHDWNTVAMTVK